jgi:methylated-DNA-[protein]-cysteine S-methyltransferase
MKQRACETGTGIFRTGLGWAGVAVSDRGITRIVLPRADRKAVERELRSGACRVSDAEAKAEKLLKKAVDLLRAHFSGQPVSFDLPLDLRYYTPFQQRVWDTCAAIPFGETRSYQWIAERIKRPKSARAVGQAMGANPVPILVP